MVTPESAIDRAYDGSTAIFRSLTAWGWADLINLGYYPPLQLWRALRGMDHFQRVLARKSVALLAPEPGELVLDVGCGRGWTTRHIASFGARAVGIDLLKRNVDLARARIDEPRSVTYITGDATDLVRCVEAAEIEPGSVDRVHCLESAFYFGPEGRRRFLEDAHALLRPGGRLVLVDFAWQTDTPEEIETLDPERLVRDTWRYEQFEPLGRYREAAHTVGFEEKLLLDWSRPVLGRFLWLCSVLCLFARFRAGRALFCRLRPGLRELELSDWYEVFAVVKAHGPIRRRARYVALVLEKPPGLDLEGRSSR